MSKDDHSKKLLNSIAKAFSANNQAKEVVGNPNASTALQTEALENAARALNTVKREATSSANLNNILNKIYNNKGISNTSSTNNKVLAYLELRGNSELSTNIGLGSTKYKNLLNAVNQKIQNQANAKFVTNVGSRPLNEKAPTRAQGLAQVAASQQNNKGTKKINNVAASLAPKPITLGNRLGRAVGRLVGRRRNNPPNTK